MQNMLTKPLNSKTSREIAVTVALIMWGVAPANPPATMVMYSFMLAFAGVKMKPMKP